MRMRTPKNNMGIIWALINLSELEIQFSLYIPTLE